VNATCAQRLTSDENVAELEKDLAKKKGIVNPTRLASFDKEKKVQIVIETPKGSRNKYAWDPQDAWPA